MARVFAIDGLVPVVDPTAFVHPTAVLIGDVIVGPGAYVGPLASLRGDFGRIVLGPGCNVQDSCTLHSFPGQDCTVAEDGHIGPGAVLHGAAVGRNALVGMNAVLMDGVVVGENAFVGALAFVKGGFQVPPGMLAAGMPARLIRALTDEEIAWKRKGTAEYQALARRCRASLVETTPLTAPEPDRRRFAAGDVVPLWETRRG
jgi:phenylacetic acid degradation protein